MEKSRYLILKDKRLIRGIIILALPLLLSNVLRLLPDLVDFYFINHLEIEPSLKEELRATLTIILPFIQIPESIALGLMIAGSSVISQYLGANKKEDARACSKTLFILMTMIGIVLNLIIFSFAPLLVKMIGIKTELFSLAVRLLRYRSLEISSFFIIMSFMATRQAVGDPFLPLLINIIIFIGHLVLVFFLNQYFWLAKVIIYFIILPFIIIMNKKNFKYQITKEKIKILLKIGLPLIGANIITSVGFLIINKMIVHFDDYVISSIGLCNRFNMLFLLPTRAIATILMTFIGQNIGSGNQKRAKESLKKAFLLTRIINFSLMIMLLIFRKPIISLFVNPTLNNLTYQLTLNNWWYLIIDIPFMAYLLIWLSFYQGIGTTKINLGLSVVRLWIIRIPLMWLLIDILKGGPSAVWYAMLISNFMMIIIIFFIYHRDDYQSKKHF